MLGILTPDVAPPTDPPTPPPIVLPISLEQIRESVVVNEATRAGVPIQMALAVSRAENPNGDTAVRGKAGEVGLFQVIPRFWSDSFPDQCYPDRPLHNPEQNSCIGIRILKRHYDHYGNWNKALRAYNGSLRYRTSGDRYVALVMSKLTFTNGVDLGLFSADGTFTANQSTVSRNPR